MTTISFYARGDGSTANNSALNVENQTQQTTVLLTFDSGPNGDIVLEYNGGAPDPDTSVIINGISYDFTVELTGTLPSGNGKTPDPLEGKTITIISVVINGSIERFFFVNDGSGTLALMDQFGNGAIPLTNANFTPPPILICFCGGTEILTPAGRTLVETLRIGDLVLTDQGETTPILWIGRSEYSKAAMQQAPEHRPIRIAAHAIAPGVPYADLFVSAQHRVVLQGWATELMFSEAKVLVAAKHLLGTIAESVMPTAAVTYYHILLEHHDMVISNGLITESFQISFRFYAGLSRDAQLSLADALPDGDMLDYFRRKDAMFSPNAPEAMVLAARLFGRTSQMQAIGMECTAPSAIRKRSGARVG